MPNVTQEFAEELRQRIERMTQARTESAERAQAEFDKLKQTRRWVVATSGLLALGAGFGVGRAFASRRE